MSHKPDAEKKLPQALISSRSSFTSHFFLLADYKILEPVEVELVDHPVTAEEPQFEALVADSECEV
jgi:hypothetical protein